MNYLPASIIEAQAIVKKSNKVHSQGGCTKNSLSSPRDGFDLINLNLLSGVLEYNPEEFTFSALAGTKISEVNQILAENHQYLPFDPLFADRGATLGGTVAAGLNGPGRYHYGGIRDFILGVKYIDYEGELIGAGAKVVKNSAGFNISKLMVGSLGAFGVIVELTFKVFPMSPASETLSINFSNLNDGLDAVIKLSTSQLDLDAIELVPVESGFKLWVRIRGMGEAMQSRVNHFLQLYDNSEIMMGENQPDIWGGFCEFSWVPRDWILVKIPIVPGALLEIEKSLGNTSCKRHYSCAGQVMWLAVQNSLDPIERILTDHKLSGLVINGVSERIKLGLDNKSIFFDRIKNALDPVGRFVEL